MAGELIREQAASLDAEDPLAGFRGRFAVDETGPLYADGNSLGRLTYASSEAVAGTVEEWGTRLVGAWEDWIDAPQRVGDLLAEHVLGARPGEVVVCDSTTVNLYKLAGAALAAEPGPIAALSHDFPTDRYVLQGLAAQFDVDLRLVSRAQLPFAAKDARLVCLSHVDYRSGEVAEMAALRPDRGLVLWDLSHSAGAVELDLEGAGADLAVGCTYKYLNGGPGAPAYLYVRKEHQERLRSPIQGWFGQRDQFEMGLRYEPAEGITRFLAGTPPMLSLLAVEAAVKLIGQAGMAVIAPKTRALTELFVYLHDQWLAPLGFMLASPRGARGRGGHVALRHPQAWPITRALIERANVVPDFREPDVIRFAFPALYTRFVDVVDVAQRTRDVVESGEHERVDASRRRVT
ncbi:MAG TPA: aminotransferase class V-fold PLP-dependent enzyme [Solirubrobacteraceae bacterium]|nr:aminotransferase class V-fold PLP-dependent enzyme [Solirubrobacteraceae bacterium]